MTAEREASRYEARLTGWARFTSIAAPPLILTGLGFVMLVFGGTDLARSTRERRIKIFSVSMPQSPPPPARPESARPARPVEAAAVIQPRQTLPQPLPVVTAPMMAAPVPTYIPLAAAPAQPSAAPSRAVPEPAADTTPVYVSNPSCSIATPAYPIRAKRLQQTGTVRVAITMDAGGHIVAETVRKSSGYDSLDEAALATVRAGKCRASAEGRPMTSILPIAFTLGQ